MEPGHAGADGASSLSIFSDQIHPARPVRTLARPDPGRPCRDLRTAWSGTVREDPSDLLLDRHAPQTSLQPQALSHLVIEIADDDGRHLLMLAHHAITPSMMC